MSSVCKPPESERKFIYFLKAERFRIAVSDASYDFINAFTLTDEKTIALGSLIDGKENILFIKGGNWL